MNQIKAIQAWFGGLSRQKQLGVLIGTPSVLALIVLWLLYSALGTLGVHHPNESLPGFLQRDGDGESWGQKIVDIQSQIDAKRVEVAKLEPLKKEYASLEAEKKSAENRLPREAERAEMSERIWQMARNISPNVGRIEVKSVTIREDSTAAAKAAGQADVRTLVYVTECVGDMNGIIQFVDYIEKNVRFMNVRSLNIKNGAVALSGGSGAGGKVEYKDHTVRMDIVTYVYTPAQSKGR